ncbi:MAG TPA: hypothetical protein VK031_01460 [Tissierellaceae bacterium]|nr:hypothetical protein [Tissierellaceae bacterium]
MENIFYGLDWEILFYKKGKKDPVYVHRYRGGRRSAIELLKDYRQCYATAHDKIILKRKQV